MLRYIDNYFLSNIVYNLDILQSFIFVIIINGYN